MFWYEFDITNTFLIATLALIIERIVGYPKFLHRAFGHPVEWYGAFLSRLDKRLNTPEKSPTWNRIKGTFTILALIIIVLIITVPLSAFLSTFKYGALVQAVLAVPLLAQKELKRFVLRVAEALENGGVEAGRKAVSHIVGRNTTNLDGSDISRAAIESLAENTSDGVVAPAFWLAVLGLPGIAVYKVINTADSMIGYRSAQYLSFGWFAAKLDDVVNFIGARITGFLFASAISLTNPFAGAHALTTIWHDARKHVSPNAGWPEAAMAGALDIALGGPRKYADRSVDLPWIGDGRTELSAKDIHKALSLYSQSVILLAIITFFCWLFV